MTNNKIENKLTNYSYWMAAPAFLLFLVFFAVPNILQLVLAFTDWNLEHLFTIKFNGLENFEMMLSESVFKESIKNTFYFAIASVLIKTVLGMALALVLNSKIPFRNFFRGIFFFPTTLSMMVVGATFTAIYHPRGPINSLLDFIGMGMFKREWLTDIGTAMNAICAMDVWAGVGYTTIIFLAGLQLVPQELYESATIDGATGVAKFLNVTLPLIMSSVTINTVLSIIGGMKVFGQVLILTNGGPVDATQVFATLIYKSFGKGYLGYASAVGLVFTLVVTVMSIIVSKLLQKREVEM